MPRPRPPPTRRGVPRPDRERGAATELAISASRKARLARPVLAPGVSSPVGVDLGSIAYVDAIERAGVPWLVLRAVSDRADEALPAFLEKCRGPDGGIRRDAVMKEAMKRPSSWPRLMSLERAVARCAEALADAVEALARAWRPGDDLERHEAHDGSGWGSGPDSSTAEPTGESISP